MEDVEAKRTFEAMIEEEVRTFASLSPAPANDYDDEWRLHRDYNPGGVEAFKLNPYDSRANLKVMYNNFMSYLDTNPFCHVPHPKFEGHHCLECGYPNPSNFEDEE